MRIASIVVAALAAALAAAEPASECLQATAGLGEPYETERRGIIESPEDAGASGRLAMRLDANQLDGAAEACYAEAAERAPGQVRWPYLQARVLTRMGRIEAALEAVRAALKLEPQLAPARLLEAELLRLTGDFEESLAAAGKALDADPQSAPARFAAGQALAGMGRDREAAEELERAIRIEPGFAQARYALALTYRRLGRVADARRELAAHERLGQTPPVETLDPYLAEVRALGENALSQAAAGAALARAGDSQSAIRLFEAALERDPDLAFAHASLVRLYGLQDFERAEEHYREAVRLEPNQADAHLDWGRLLLRRGRTEEAVEALKEAVRASPYNAAARLELGVAFESLGHLGEAVEQYQAAYQSDPLDDEVPQRLGAALLTLGRIEEGLDILEKTVDTGNGRAAEYLEALARDYERRGEPRIALGYARRALARARRDGRTELIESLESRVETLSKKVGEP